MDLKYVYQYLSQINKRYFLHMVMLSKWSELQNAEAMQRE
jgi:hypothetical protein